MTDRLPVQEAQRITPSTSLTSLLAALQRRESRLSRGFDDGIFNLDCALRNLATGGAQGPETAGSDTGNDTDFINSMCGSFGITSSGDLQKDAAAARTRLEQFSTALKHGNFAVLAEHATQAAVIRDRVYAPHISVYLQTIADIEERLKTDGGTDPNGTLGELLELSKLKLNINGFSEDDLAQPQSAREAYLRGEHKTLVDTQKNAAESLHPFMVVMKALRRAKLNLAQRQIGIEHAAGKEEHIGEDENIKRQEILGGIEALQKALTLIEGGKVAEVQAYICRVISELFGRERHSEGIFVMRQAGGWVDDQALDMEIMAAAQKHWAQRRRIADKEEFEGEERAAMEWALPKMQAIRGEITFPPEPQSLKV